jgi:hypothetical protein
MTVEHCDECGFDGSEWTDQAALDAVEDLPERWQAAISGLNIFELHRRPLSDMWSIAEYADHEREVLFGMRFLLDIAVDRPGTDLGTSPVPRFDREARPVDLEVELTRITEEVKLLSASFATLAPAAWASVVVLDGQQIDPHWIVRHALYDPTHHLLDVERLRSAL